MICSPYSKARRRCSNRLIIALSAYLVFLFIAEWTFRRFHPTGLLIYLLAILPALPLVTSLCIVGLYIAEESDEFERSIFIQSMLWGFGGALSVSTIWGFLSDFTNAPRLSTFYVYVFFWIFMAISQPFIRMRYQ